MKEDITVSNYVKDYIKKEDKVTRLLISNYSLHNTKIKKIFAHYGQMTPEEMIELINKPDEGATLASIGFGNIFKDIKNTAPKLFSDDSNEIMGAGLENAMYQNSLPSSNHKIGK